MGPIALALIGAGLGALKSSEEKNMWADQQKAEAEKTRYGAWTGMKGDNLKPPTGDMGNMMTGAMAGYAIGASGDKGVEPDAEPESVDLDYGTMNPGEAERVGLLDKNWDTNLYQTQSLEDQMFREGNAELIPNEAALSREPYLSPVTPEMSNQEIGSSLYRSKTPSLYDRHRKISLVDQNY